MHRFWDIRLVSIPCNCIPWNLGWGSFKVIEDDIIQSGTHDFLLTFHSNHRPILHRFRDKRRFPSKTARKSPFFPYPVYLTPPLKGFRLELGIGTGARRNLNDDPTDGQNSFKIDLAILIQYRRVTDRHPATQLQPPSYPATQPRRRSIYRGYYVARVTRNSAIAHKAARQLSRFVFQVK